MALWGTRSIAVMKTAGHQRGERFDAAFVFKPMTRQRVCHEFSGLSAIAGKGRATWGHIGVRPARRARRVDSH